jgi:hypothetical protein
MIRQGLHQHRAPTRLLSSGNHAYERFSHGVLRARADLTRSLRRDIYLGESETGAPVYLPQKLLFDHGHMMVMAPTNHGKSSLIRLILRSFSPCRYSIFADDPKSDMIGGIQEDCAALGLGDRVHIFDTSDPDRMPLFNPLKRNGVSAEDQTLWLLNVIRACHKSDSFDEQPQRFRWMGNSLLPVIEGEGSFEDVLDMLDHTQSGTREYFLEATSNERVVAEWANYEALSPTRRRDETYSSYGWLRKFVLSERFRRMTTPHPDSFDVKDFLLNAGILLASFPRYRPLDADSVDFLRSSLLQFLCMYGFAIPLTERPRLILVLDEAEHVLERDGQLIETILSEGRSLGIHLCLIFHTFSQITKSNPALLASVLTHCKTKFLGGRLYQEDLEVLTKDLFTSEWHPHLIRDELYSLETEPVETTRETVSQSYTYQEGTSLQRQHTKTTTRSTGVSDGTQDSAGTSAGETISAAQSHVDSRGTALSHAESEQEADSSQWSRSRALGESRAKTFMDSETEMASDSWMDANSSMQGAAESLGAGTALSFPMDDGLGLLPANTVETTNAGSSVNAGRSVTAARGGSSGRARSRGEADTAGKSVVEAEAVGGAHARGRGVTNGIVQTQNSADATVEGRSTNRSTNASHGTTHQVTANTSLGETYGESPGETESESWGETRTIVPFHELRKRWVVSSREFLSLQDFLTTQMNRLSGAKQGRWVVQPPEGKAVFFRARWVKPLPGGKERLPALFQKAFDRPAWRAMRETLPRMLNTPAESLQVKAYRVDSPPVGEHTPIVPDAACAPPKKELTPKRFSLKKRLKRRQ